MAPSRSIRRGTLSPVLRRSVLGPVSSWTGDQPLTSLPSFRQLVLPSCRQFVTDVPRFAHPFERDFADLLDFFRVRWSYEPTSFCLRRNDAGLPIESFTPDFYLPEINTYIELTSMRQCLVTRKHRKLRRLRQTHPGVRVTMLYRRDYQRLLAGWSAKQQRVQRVAMQSGDLAIPSAWLNESLIAERLDTIADSIVRDNNGSPPPVLLAMGAGATRIVEALASRLARAGTDAVKDHVELSRFRPERVGQIPSTEAHRVMVSRSRVRVQRPPTTDMRGQTVVIIASIVSSGLSVRYLAQWLKRRGAAVVEVCAFLDRRSARVCDLPIRYLGFEAPADLLIGFGLDLHRQYRELPYIAMLAARQPEMPSA